MVVVASPSPSRSRWAAPLPAAAPGRPHPTYTDMITYALAHLGGASARSAIAGFIAARFTALPVSHDALLSAHLRRLVAEGVLCNSGFSYFLSTNINPDLHSHDQSTSLLGEKRKSCRPIIIDKQLPPVHPPAPAPAPAAASSAPVKRPSPAMSAETEAPTHATAIKRGRGRPRKDKPAAAAMLDETHAGDAAVSAAGIKRGRGRPRKDKPAAAAAAMLDATQAGDAAGPAAGIKRGRGRPRKDKPAAAAMLAETQARKEQQPAFD